MGFQGEISFLMTPVYIYIYICMYNGPKPYVNPHPWETDLQCLPDAPSNLIWDFQKKKNSIPWETLGICGRCIGSRGLPAQGCY